MNPSLASRSGRAVLPEIFTNVHHFPRLRTICVASAIAAGFYGNLMAQTNTFPSSGNVGLGTTSPSSLLTVDGNGDFFSADPHANLNNTSTGHLASFELNPSDQLLIGWNQASIILRAGANNVLTATGSGNVGIGTISPTEPLTLMSSSISSSTTVASFTAPNLGNGSRLALFVGRTEGQNNAGYVGFIPSATANQSLLTFGQFGANELMTIRGDGNVGIGTSAPTEPLTLTNSSIASSTTVASFTAPNLGNGSRLALFVGRTEGQNNAGYVGFIPNATANQSLLTFGQFGANELMAIRGDGNVGIGTTNPTQKLSVAGTIQAYEVLVQTGWSDYVFDDNYRLQPLKEVERDIKTDHHLPGIPSAKEVAQNGVSMGEMEAKLLAKVEELTLHAIDQEKRLDAQAAKIDVLESKNAALEAQISAFSGETP